MTNEVACVHIQDGFFDIVKRFYENAHREMLQAGWIETKEIAISHSSLEQLVDNILSSGCKHHVVVNHGGEDVCTSTLIRQRDLPASVNLQRIWHGSSRYR